MSKENVELVRRVFDGWAQGDFSVGRELLTPDFEWEQRTDAVEPGTKRGAEVGTALKGTFEVFADYRIVAEEFLDADDKVFVASHATGVARGSGLELNQPFYFVWTVRDGKLARNQTFGKRADALAAARLTP